MSSCFSKPLVPWRSYRNIKHLPRSGAFLPAVFPVDSYVFCQHQSTIPLHDTVSYFVVPMRVVASRSTAGAVGDRGPALANAKKNEAAKRVIFKLTSGKRTAGARSLHVEETSLIDRFCWIRSSQESPQNTCTRDAQIKLFPSGTDGELILDSPCLLCC